MAVDPMFLREGGSYPTAARRGALVGGISCISCSTTGGAAVRLVRPRPL
ncbi:MAG: hypothetical protein MO852_02220 [Candidatus Devosia euplotis]|nr:hypothetical protein [Candidatus Devosia euplotis]